MMQPGAIYPTFGGTYVILGHSTRPGPDPEVEAVLDKIREKAGHTPVVDFIQQDAGVIQGNRVSKEIRVVYTDDDADNARHYAQKANTLLNKWAPGANPPPEELYLLDKAESALEDILQQSGGLYRQHYVDRVAQKLDSNLFDWLDGNEFDRNHGDWFDYLPQDKQQQAPNSQTDDQPADSANAGFSWDKVLDFLDELFGQ